MPKGFGCAAQSLENCNLYARELRHVCSRSSFDMFGHRKQFFGGAEGHDIREGRGWGAREAWFLIRRLRFSFLISSFPVVPRPRECKCLPR